MDYLFKIETIPSNVTVTQNDFSDMIQNPRVEDSLVSSFYQLSQKYSNTDSNFAKKIVDNMKTLIDNRIDNNMIEMKTIYDDIATITAEISEIKNIIDKMVLAQKKCNDECHDIIRAMRVESENADKIESMSFKAFVWSVPLFIITFAFIVHQVLHI